MICIDIDHEIAPIIFYQKVNVRNIAFSALLTIWVKGNRFSREFDDF